MGYFFIYVGIFKFYIGIIIIIIINDYRYIGTVFRNKVGVKPWPINVRKGE